MAHITEFITKYSWEDILITLLVIVDDICLFLYGASSRLRARSPQPAMADSEVITMAIFSGGAAAGSPAEEPEERDKWFGVVPSKRKKKFVGPRLHFTTALEGVVDM